MSHRKISAALAFHLQTLGYQTAYENAPFTPSADDVYLAENYLPTTTQEVGMEEGSTNNFSGIYQITVNAPRDKYKADGFAAAEAVAEHFKRLTKVTYESVTATVQRVQQAGGIEQGDRWIIPISVEFIALVK